MQFVIKCWQLGAVLCDYFNFKKSVLCVFSFGNRACTDEGGIGSVEGALGAAPSLGTLEDMLGKSPDAGITLHGGPFPSEGNLVFFFGGGGSYPGDFE